MKVQLANAWHLTSCMRNHSQSSKLVNSSPLVVDTPAPAVYNRTLILYRINSV